MNRVCILTAIPTLLIGSMIGTMSDAADKVRRCDGEYRWETTGGSVNGAFGVVTAYGKKSTAANARKAARAAMMDCFQEQWDKRWRRVVTNRCKIGAKVERYEVNTKCVRRTDNLNPALICDDSGHATKTKLIIDVPDGDLKTALEVQVCCLNRDQPRLADGTRDFGNNESVFVRLSGHSWSTNTHTGYQQECNGKRDLTNNYEINCSKVRNTICKRP